jgi:glucoamylase
VTLCTLAAKTSLKWCAAVTRVSLPRHGYLVGMPSRTALLAASTSVLVLALPLAADAGAAQPRAAGAPGATPTFAPADKHGFGTARAARSRVWYTLRQSTMTEAYYPDLGTPATRDLELVVSDGSHVERESTGANGRVELLDGARSLTYRQTTTSKSGTWRATKTYVTDPVRRTVMVDITLTALEGRRLKAWVLIDPQLSNDGRDDRADTRHGALVARDAHAASALAAHPAFTATSSGYRGRSDGWDDIKADGRLDRRTYAEDEGNVAQVGQTTLTGRGDHRHLTLALGFGETTAVAVAGAKSSLKRGFASAARQYADGWHRYLDALGPPPSSVAADPRLYDASLLVLAASEDKAHPGASVASPTMPWAWGDLSIEKPKTGAYHLVWGRDLYQVATAQLAAGDVAAADRLLDFVLQTQQKPDGTVPQNSEVDGTPHWTKLQLDEVALPIVLAWQLHRTDDASWTRVRRAAEAILRRGPKTQQERWENQSGFSPATIAAEIAGLVCAADLARQRGDLADAQRYEATADAWARDVQSWTATTNGPYAPKPYYLRITKDRQPDQATTYKIGDGGPSKADQRAVVDPSFLELVRLGIKPADDPVIRNTIGVVDQKLGVPTPAGLLWHRFTYDGYGESGTGAPWGIGKDDTFVTHGRAWPIFAGERGEYALQAGDPAGAAAGLRAMAGTANDGLMLPEQAWDGRRPTGTQGRKLGENTLSATPLAWSHAQYVRLAWSLARGAPVEQPAVVACRYTGRGCG